MQKFLLPALVCAMIAGGASAETKVTVTPLGDRPVSQMKKVVSTADILVTQDFSSLTEPFVDAPVSSLEFTQTNPNHQLDGSDYSIPAEYMGGQKGWKGNFVYSGDGTCVIQTVGPGVQYASYLDTPMGDYSGSLVITFMARYLPTYWYVTNDEGEMIRNFYTGSSVTVSLETPDPDKEFETEGGWAYSLADVRLYDTQGWCEVRIEVDNLSAYNDAFLRFYTYETIEIDNIKVTSSHDNFIAAPVPKSVTNVTETSFTANWEPVRASYDYYVYLYSIEGYEKNGAPILQPVLSPADLETIEVYAEYYGMTVEEFIEMYLAEWDFNDPYMCYDRTGHGETSYTFTDLDPEKEYCYGLRSHNVNTFSDQVIYQQTILPTPVGLMASDVEKDSFVAEWEPVTKAEQYLVSLYGVTTVAKADEEYWIIDEEFGKTEGETYGTVSNPEVLEQVSYASLNAYTALPGWEVCYGNPLLADGMIGVRGYGAYISTPELYLKGSDTLTVHARVESPDKYAGSFLMVCGQHYEYLNFENGVWEGELTCSTGGADWGYVKFADIEGTAGILIDDIIITRSVEKGENIYSYLQSEYLEGDTAMKFTGLEEYPFGVFGFNVMAIMGDDWEARTSARSEMKIVYPTGFNVANVVSASSSEIEAVYDINGSRLDAPVKGINVIRYTDGTTRKVIVK